MSTTAFERTCKVCSIPATPGNPLKMCARCLSAFYCSTACQSQDWKSGNHKNSCRDPTKPRIVFIALRDSHLLKAVWGNLLTALRVVASVRLITKVTEAIAVIPGSDTVILADGAAASNTSVATAATKYVKIDGGTLLLASLFSSTISVSTLDGFLKDYLGLPWRYSSYHRSVYHLAPGAAKFVGLPQSFSQKAANLQGVSPEDAVYYLPSEDPDSDTESPEQERINEYPTAWTRLGNGWLGWVGDVNAEEGTIDVTLRMCGF